MTEKSITEGLGFSNVRINLIVRRIATFCKERSIDLFEIFSKADESQTFKLSEEIWNRTLDLLNLPKKVLSEEEKKELTVYFQNIDGLINYIAFCNVIDNAAYYLTCSNDEISKKIIYPDIVTGKGWLPFDLEEDCIFYDLMMNIAGVCCQNGYDMKEYGSETDRVTRYGPGKITIEHFSKILYKAGIYLKPDEFSIIIKKFVDNNYLMNFKLFCECINKLEETAHLAKCDISTNELLARRDKAKRTEVKGREPARELLGYNENDHPLNRFLFLDEDIKTLMYRIHDHLFKYSIRDFTELFKAKDPLNFGKITKESFMAILSTLGIATGTLGNLTLTREEVEKIMKFYGDRLEKGKVLWKDFYNDMNSVWCYRTGIIGKTPDILLGCEVSPHYGFQSLNDRGTKYFKMKLNERMQFEDIISKDNAQKTISLVYMPLIYQFDKERNNHMLISRFRAAMDNIGRRYSNREMELLEAKYYDQYGFNYRKYLEDIKRVTESNLLTPKIHTICESSPLYSAINLEKKNLECKTVQEQPNYIDIMNKIRYLLQPFNPNIWQFLNQSNKTPNKYILQKGAFSSALATAGATITDEEVDILFKIFKIDTLSGEYIDYRKFHETLERMDKISLGYPTKCYPPEIVDFMTADKTMSMEKLNELEKLLERISEKFTETSVCELDYKTKKFMNFDRFIRELDVSLNLGNIITPTEQMLLFTAFSKPFGTSNAVNFEDFVRHLKRVKYTCKDVPARHQFFYKTSNCPRN